MNQLRKGCRARYIGSYMKYYNKSGTILSTNGLRATWLPDGGILPLGVPLRLLSMIPLDLLDYTIE